MQSRNITITLLLGVFALGLLGAQQSYATNYVLLDSGCGGLVFTGIATWDGVDTCTLTGELIIDDDNGDSLTVGPGITLDVADETVLDIIGALIQVAATGTLVNNGELYSDGDIDIAGTFNNFNIFESSGELGGDGSINNNSPEEFINGGTILIIGEFTNTSDFHKFRRILYFCWQ